MNAIFSSGCRPAELLRAANPTATSRCTISGGDGRLLTARCDCVRVQDGFLTAVRLNGEPDLSAADRSAWLGAILDTADTIIVVLDQDGRFVQFNRAAEDLTGFRAEEVIGKYFWSTVLFDEDVAALRATFDDLATCTDISMHYENRWRMRDGSARTLSWSTVVTRSLAGNVEYLVSTGIDVTSFRTTAGELASLSGEFMAAQSAVASPATCTIRWRSIWWCSHFRSGTCSASRIAIRRRI